MKLAAIIGPSYSASTVLNAILDGLPGVVGVGETHWIADADEQTKWAQRCRYCGEDSCPVFTDELLTTLRSNPEQWWANIAASAGARVLVSADKSPGYFERFGLPDLALVPWRDPRAWVTGLLARQPQRELSWATEQFFTRYRHVTSWLDHHRIPWASVDMYGGLIDAPEDHVGHLARFLGVSFEPRAWAFWEYDHHSIAGGNMTGGFGKRVKNWSKGTDRLQRNEAWRERLSPEEAAAVIGDARVRYTVQLLRRQDVCDRPPLLGRQRRAAERFVWRIRGAIRHRLLLR